MDPEREVHSPESLSLAGLMIADSLVHLLIMRRVLDRSAIDSLARALTEPLTQQGDDYEEVIGIIQRSVERWRQALGSVDDMTR